VIKSNNDIATTTTQRSKKKKKNERVAEDRTTFATTCKYANRCADNFQANQICSFGRESHGIRSQIFLTMPSFLHTLTRFVNLFWPRAAKKSPVATIELPWQLQAITKTLL